MRPDRIVRILVTVLAAGLVGHPPVSSAADHLADRVLVVYNTAEPASRLLAEEYAAKRSLPADRLCPITVRAAETITRKEFEEQIRQPIRAYMVDRRFLVRGTGIELNPFTRTVPAIETERSEIVVILLIYGVPLRIDSDPRLLSPLSETPPGAQRRLQRNEASVDTELALLPTDDAPLVGALQNPFFGKLALPFGHPLNRYMLMVGRLDGPSPAVVRRMMDDALRSERFGLHGRAYFDAQDARDPGYRVGDDWLRASAAMFRGLGYETVLDNRAALFGEADGVGDVAIYGGWYAHHVSGVFTNETFRFRPGSVAYHIHSSSASSVRSRTAYWAGPLLDRGAAVTMGNVYEPYLQMSPHLDRFFQRLTRGGTFIEAAYNSQPALSWQATFVGDPLYRPFGTGLDEQIRRLEQERHPDRSWAYLRKINLLNRRGSTAEAVKLCEQQATALLSAILFEKLGELQRQAGLADQAAAAYRRARQRGEETGDQALVQRIDRALETLPAGPGRVD